MNTSENCEYKYWILICEYCWSYELAIWIDKLSYRALYLNAYCMNKKAIPVVCDTNTISCYKWTE